MKTEAFKKEKKSEMDFIKSSPFYGGPLSEKMYMLLKNTYNVLQVGVFGQIVSVVSYKKDDCAILSILNRMFPERRVLQKESEFTGFITTYTLPNIK